MTRTDSFPKKRKPLAAYLVAPLAVGALVLTGCAGNAPGPQANTTAPAADAAAFMSDHGLAGLDTRQVIDRLDALPVAQRPQNLMASVRPDQLMLADDRQRQAVLPLPEDQFYLSFAPFRTQTHDCHFHSLTTCLGEMQNEEVKVTVTDAKSGETLVDKTMSTFDNGFVGLWLPRGIEATLTVESRGKRASTPISTSSSEDATCLTTLQLT
ncbi:MAG: CueP family metal-binding protein [Paeniglutamicibacter sp.]